MQRDTSKSGVFSTLFLTFAFVHGRQFGQKFAKCSRRNRISTYLQHQHLRRGRMHAYLQLPENGRIRRMALEHRKALGLRLARLGPGVARRKRAAAWGRWVQETLRLMEEQHTVSKCHGRRVKGRPHGKFCVNSSSPCQPLW